MLHFPNDAVNTQRAFEGYNHLHLFTKICVNSSAGNFSSLEPLDFCRTMLNFLPQPLQKFVLVIFNSFMQTLHCFNLTVACIYAQILPLSIDF